MSQKIIIRTRQKTLKFIIDSKINKEKKRQIINKDKINISRQDKDKEMKFKLK